MPRLGSSVGVVALAHGAVRRWCVVVLCAAVPAAAFGQESQCPSPDAVWQELTTLLPRADLEARLRGPDGTLEVDDLGGSFRIALLERARVYRDEARDCTRRAHMGALFAALVIDSSGQLARAEPPPPEPPVPPPPPTPPPAPASAAGEVAPDPPRVRLELGPAVATGLDGQSWSASWGGALRVAVGRHRLAWIAGLAAGWPSETMLGGARLRQWRLPVDLGVRATLPLGTWAAYGELGLVVALLSERALALAAARSAATVTVGGRLALGVRLANRAFCPYVSLALELVPDPPRVVALPAGELGRTSTLWLGASAGISWGPR